MIPSRYRNKGKERCATGGYQLDTYWSTNQFLLLIDMEGTEKTVLSLKSPNCESNSALLTFPISEPRLSAIALLEHIKYGTIVT